MLGTCRFNQPVREISKKIVIFRSSLIGGGGLKSQKLKFERKVHCIKQSLTEISSRGVGFKEKRHLWIGGRGEYGYFLEPRIHVMFT